MRQQNRHPNPDKPLNSGNIYESSAFSYVVPVVRREHLKPERERRFRNELSTLGWSPRTFVPLLKWLSLQESR